MHARGVTQYSVPSVVEHEYSSAGMRGTGLCALRRGTKCCHLQKDLVPVCRELGIGIVCYSPIGRGMLTGKYSKIEDMDPSDFRRSTPRFAEEAFQKVPSANLRFEYSVSQQQNCLTVSAVL